MGLTINAMYPHRLRLSTKVRRFIDLLPDHFTEHRKWMSPAADRSEIAHPAVDYEIAADREAARIGRNQSDHARDVQRRAET